MTNEVKIKEEVLLELCRQVGHVIRRYYDEGFNTFTKKDKSPLTNADLASHDMIVETLKLHYPHIPILSEESASASYEDRCKWEYFWLVDPLDGTKEFIHHQDEFTVNIALIRENLCEFGMVYVPVYDVTYIGYRNRGSWKVKNSDRTAIRPSVSPYKNRKIKVGISRFHLDDKTRSFLDTFQDRCEPVVCGSALKFCYVADGTIDLYLRFGTTWEWDTGAGQAVVESAGGAVFDLSGESVSYNKPSLKNGPLIATGNKEWFLQSDFWQWIRLRTD